MSEQNPEKVEKKPRTRSPAYPSMALEGAIAKAKILYDKEGFGRHEIPIQSVATDWDYTSAANSATLVGISALKQYGLMEDVEDADPRRFVLTPLAIDIIAREKDAPERIKAIRDAAVKPKIFAEMLKKWGFQLPSDATIRSELTIVKLFNPDVVDGLIKDFKATISFAKLDKQDTIGGVAGQKPPDTTKEADMPSAIATQTEVDKTPMMEQVVTKNTAIVVRDFSVPLDDGKAIILRVPLPLSEEDFETLLGTLKLWKKKFTGKAFEEPKSAQN